MHTDSGMTGISLSGYMPYMTVASLEMSDEPLLMFVTADEEYLRYCKRNNFIYNSQINALTDRTEICIFNIPLVESNIEKRYIVESER